MKEKSKQSTNLIEEKFLLLRKQEELNLQAAACEREILELADSEIRERKLQKRKELLEEAQSVADRIIANRFGREEDISKPALLDDVDEILKTSQQPGTKKKEGEVLVFHTSSNPSKMKEAALRRFSEETTARVNQPLANGSLGDGTLELLRAKENEFHQRDEDLCEWEEDLGSRERKLLQRQANIAQRERGVEERERNVGEREETAENIDKLPVLANALMKRHREACGGEESLLKREEDVREKARIVAEYDNRRRAVEALEEDVRVATESLEAVNSKADSLGNRSKRLKEQIASRKNDASKLKAKIQSLRVSKAKLDQLLPELDANKDAFDSEVAELKKKIAPLKKECKTLESRKEQLEKDHCATSNHLDDLNSSIKNIQKEIKCIEKKTACLPEKENELQTVLAELKVKSAQLDEIKKQLAAAQGNRQENEEVQKHMDAISDIFRKG